VKDRKRKREREKEEEIVRPKLQRNAISNSVNFLRKCPRVWGLLFYFKFQWE